MIPQHQEDVKLPRDCELCLNKHAVWYCASDDAFLCNVCDESVHCANQVATKHERVCIQTNDVVYKTISNPVWHTGFKRKARSPRGRCDKKPLQKIDEERREKDDPRVPEIVGRGMFNIPKENDDDNNDDDNDDDDDDAIDDEEDLTSLVPEFQGFMEMGLFLNNHDGSEETMRQFNFDQDEEACHEHSLMSYENVIAVTTKKEAYEDYNHESNKSHKNMLLRLNYENVIAAWDKQKSPRNQTYEFNNTRSNFQLVPQGIEEKKVSNKSEREARVWRYRDKRKNRLFEKKIRYQVRKVNADKRPRMKGRFVRRSLAIAS
ncbi:unnamed protein product [Cochlearia groenlandica]